VCVCVCVCVYVSYPSLETYKTLCLSSMNPEVKQQRLSENVAMSFLTICNVLCVLRH